jgi:predicted  nucleic acid-binding Zn-ribbon protein
MERGEIVTRSIAEEEQAMKATQERVAKEQTMLDEKAESLRQAVAVKSAERERLIAGLDAALLTRYEKIREVKDGLAVVTVQNGACGGCYRRIPPQEMQILRRSDRIKTCEGCGRILIYREETGQAQPGQDARRDTGEPPSQQDVQ